MPTRLRRSCLTVPGDDERKLAKAATIAVDEVILDLEDAVATARKDEARETVARALRDLDWTAPTVAIRVNRGSAGDLELVRAVRPDVVVLPKVESPNELEGLPGVEHALFRVAVAARAFGLAPVDGPHAVLGDDDGLRASALR